MRAYFLVKYNVKEIVTKYLKDNGYDGLYSEDADCACDIADLMFCEGDFGDIAPCKTGYKVACPDDCGEHEFHIVEKKP